MKKNKLIGKKVISKKFGEGIIKYVENDDNVLPYAVEFKKSNAALHSCCGRCESLKGYWCTLDIKHNDASEIIELTEAKAFTKKDLKVGDIITLRDGQSGVWDGKDFGAKYACLFEDNIENDLTNNGAQGSKLDIVKVERITATEVVFERKEETTEILDEAEKEYLSSVIKPFRARVKYIRKLKCGDKEFIEFLFEDETLDLPYFKKGSMYKGMIAENSYSLEELGL